MSVFLWRKGHGGHKLTCAGHNTLHGGHKLTYGGHNTLHAGHKPYSQGTFAVWYAEMEY